MCVELNGLQLFETCDSNIQYMGIVLVQSYGKITIKSK